MKNINLSPIALTLLTWFCLGSTLLAEEAAGEKKQTVWEMFHGGGLVMYLLLVASILIMAFTIEAFIKIRMGRLAPPAVLAQLKDAIVSGNYPLAYQV